MNDALEIAQMIIKWQDDMDKMNKEKKYKKNKYLEIKYNDKERMAHLNDSESLEMFYLFYDPEFDYESCYDLYIINYYFPTNYFSRLDTDDKYISFELHCYLSEKIDLYLADLIKVTKILKHRFQLKKQPNKLIKMIWRIFGKEI